MWQLYQFPLCPFSRKVRLTMAEKGIAVELVRVSPWLDDDDFADLTPAKQTPVLVEASKGIVLIDSTAIAEYFEETVDRAPMIPGTAPNRAEIRRLVNWFDIKLYQDAVAPLMHERMLKRLITREPPDAQALRRAPPRERRTRSIGSPERAIRADQGWTTRAGPAGRPPRGPPAGPHRASGALAQ